MALPSLYSTAECVFLETLVDLSEMDKSDELNVRRDELVREQREIEVIKLERIAAQGMLTPYLEHGKTGGMSPSEKDTAEAKRARRSAIEKKSRQRRLGMLRRMREEVKQLENVYAEMVMNSRLVSDKAECSSVSMDELQKKYSELSLAAHALEEDQRALHKLLQSHRRFQQIVEEFSDEKKEVAQTLWVSGIPPSSSFAVRFRHLSPDECYAIVREAYQRIERYCDATSFETTGANFMGWTDKRKVDAKLQVLQFCFTKRFPLENTEHLLSQTWEILSNGAKLKEVVFNNSIRTRFEVIQRLNDNLIIVRRDHKLSTLPMTFVSVQIIFRMETPTGYIICNRTIPAPDIQEALEPHEYFYDAFHWIRFNHLFDEQGNSAGCGVVAGGCVSDQNQLQSKYWLFEIVCSMLRWEHTCVAPLFLKQI